MAVGEGVGVDVAVGNGVLVGVTVGVGLCVGVGVLVGTGVDVGVGVKVGVGVAVGTGVNVGAGVSVGTGEGVAVAVGLTVAVALGCGSASVSCGAALASVAESESGKLSGSSPTRPQPTIPKDSSTAMPHHATGLTYEASLDLPAVLHIPASNLPHPATEIYIDIKRPSKARGYQTRDAGAIQDKNMSTTQCCRPYTPFNCHQESNSLNR